MSCGPSGSAAGGRHPSGRRHERSRAVGLAALVALLLGQPTDAVALLLTDVPGTYCLIVLVAAAWSAGIR